MTRTAAVFAFALLAVNVPIKADAQSVDAFDVMVTDESDMTRGLFIGTIQGYAWANIALSKEGHEAMYCQPEDRVSGLELARAAAVIGGQLLPQETRTPDAMPLAILLGLKAMFPC